MNTLCFSQLVWDVQETALRLCSQILFEIMKKEVCHCPEATTRTPKKDHDGVQSISIFVNLLFKYSKEKQ